MIAKTFLAVLAGGEPFLVVRLVVVDLFLPVAFRAVGGNDWTATQKGVATCGFLWCQHISTFLSFRRESRPTLQQYAYRCTDIVFPYVSLLGVL